MKITAKKKPLRLDVRWRLANLLINIARRIKPSNPEVMAYLLEIATENYIETVMYGESVACSSCGRVLSHKKGPTI
jgi:hypothetical protein